MARFRLKYYLKGPLNPNQPTNQYMDGYSQMLSHMQVVTIYHDFNFKTTMKQT